jgi:hypothetical protein
MAGRNVPSLVWIRGRKDLVSFAADRLKRLPAPHGGVVSDHVVERRNFHVILRG